MTVSALDLATAALGLAQGGHQVQFNLAAGVPGVTAITVTLAVGQRPSNSPWIAITDKNDVIVSTAQARAMVKIQVAPAGSALAGVASINVPIIVELAPAQAKLADIQWAGKLFPQELNRLWRRVVESLQDRLLLGLTDLAVGLSGIDHRADQHQGLSRLPLGAAGWQFGRFPGGPRPLTGRRRLRLARGGGNRLA